MEARRYSMFDIYCIKKSCTICAMKINEQVRALTLLSGGLDSQLAVCVLQDQGIDVHGVVFKSPFFQIRSALRAAKELKVELHVMDFTDDIISLVKDPPHGLGSCMNPCIDCHALMLRRAGEYMKEQGFHFLSTGEVLDERPMSQNKRSLKIVAGSSGYEDYIVRPLSAGLLPESGPERNGLVDRSRLLSLRGRGRKPQFALAEQYGIKDYPSPAGGCRLTEPNFCKRLKDLLLHEGLDVRAINLLLVGRHFRLAEKIKLIVGRNKDDNQSLEETAGPRDMVLKVADVPGPTGLLPDNANEEQIRYSAEICARYSDASEGRAVAVQIISSQGESTLSVLPADREKIEIIRIK
jgi:tRNA U34 2-thiouridine synthase MnmA/TrmU